MKAWLSLLIAKQDLCLQMAPSICRLVNKSDTTIWYHFKDHCLIIALPLPPLDLIVYGTYCKRSNLGCGNGLKMHETTAHICSK